LVVDGIRRALDQAGLETYPDFEAAYYDSEIAVRLKTISANGSITLPGIEVRGTGVVHPPEEPVVAYAYSDPAYRISCNQHLGANLDVALVNHPLIAFAVQFLGLRGGQKGGLRPELGGITGDEPRSAITIPVALDEAEVEWDDQGRIASRAVSVQQLAQQGADDWKFSRALHHVAMNVVAYAKGWQFMIHPDFNPVRRYVREPLPDQQWPYALRSGSLSAIPDQLDAETIDGTPDGIIRLRIFQIECFVDIRNREGFESWVRANLPQDTLFRRPSRRRLRRPRALYQLTIYV
jgi:hypothetical protein